MIESFNIQALIDIIFAIVVVVACYTTLAQGSRAGDKKAAKWRDELIELQTVLKELIEDASIASNNLDRRLLRRKEELEALLQKIDDKQKLQKADELPNPTWSYKKEVELNNSSEKKAEDFATNQNQQTPFDQNEELDRLINFSKSINKEIEKTDTPMVDLGLHNFANQIDPTTYKIAKRLITEGQEIHVVARKLEMPLAQVRLLDRIIRNEAAIDNQNRAAQRSSYGYDVNARQVVNGDY